MNEDKYQPFSVRQGVKQPKPIQLESMDEDLHNGLWNAFDGCFPLRIRTRSSSSLRSIQGCIWTGFLKRPADEYNKQSLTLIKNIFLRDSWNEVFDLIEFVIRFKFPVRENFIARCNAVLKEENSAYKIVGELVTEITSQEEIESIETAMETPFAGANEHIRKALSLLSRRENPDYANSIKESISAVESIAQEITGKEKSLNALTQELNLPPTFKTGLDALYNWTSQEGGIRHGASSESLNPDPKTARFMLIICSAFVHYIIAENPTTPPPSPKSGTRRT